MVFCITQYPSNASPFFVLLGTISRLFEICFTLLQKTLLRSKITNGRESGDKMRLRTLEEAVAPCVVVEEVAEGLGEGDCLVV